MARTDQVTAAKTAMMIQFWRTGYHQTTVDELLTVSQLSRTQFYREFRRKPVALRQCLQLYQATINEQLTRLIERDRARQTPLYALLADCLLLPFQSERWPAGCLMVNLMAELGPEDTVVKAQLQTVYADFQSRLVALLAPVASDLPAAVATVAASLMQARSGLQLLAKQDPSASQLKRQAQASVQLILGERVHG
ncbi:TetR/AcrR family transcriptional regulator [Lactiplantibacillus plajomi]|uniref:TetR/AcrR family transcriptional regulator n=1 Tax=Lactiplantibacillus plajomi TaxID=1457217 RepID=A0ABV6K617_9LACO|nr:TetR family transcriptional regulator [Lactiplantibacillus plajomi]